jgi:nicotinamide-nucleotide amidase
VEKELRKRLGNHIYGVDGEALEFVVGKMLEKKKKTLAVAESCTGGLIASRITDISGSSSYFKMGAVVYSNEAKTKILKIPKDKIKRYGAVSKEVALDMAAGLTRVSGSDIALAVTGIAGPTGATATKPVGLVYIAVTAGKVKTVKECRFTGNRKEIKLQASTAALDLVRMVLCEHS